MQCDHVKKNLGTSSLAYWRMKCQSGSLKVIKLLSLEENEGSMSWELSGEIETAV